VPFLRGLGEPKTGSYKYFASNGAKKITNRQSLIANRGSCPDINWQLAIGNRKSAFLDLALLGMRLVGFNDHLHQLVPDDVFVAEVNEVNAIDAGQDALSLDQTAAFSCR